MLDQTVYEGYWWLPDNPENKVPGTINIDDEQNITLSTLGSLLGSGHFQKYNAVTGITKEGKHITLLDCSCCNSSLNFPGIDQYSYKARVLFIGIILESNQSLLFNHLSFKCTHLEDWIGRSGLDITGAIMDSNQFDIQYRRPQSLEFTLLNNYKLSIKSGIDRKVNFKEIHLKEQDWITIEPPEKKDIDTLLDVVNHLRNFLSLVIGEPVYITQLNGSSELATRDINGKKYYESINIALSKIQQPKKQKNNKIPLLPLAEVEDELKSILGRWFDCKNIIEPVINLYFYTLYKEAINLQGDFLFLTQAVETYHRRTSEEKESSEEEHNYRLEQILSSVHEDYQDWLESKLRYSNELSLRKRLKTIIDQFSNIFGDYIHRKKFTDKVVNTRNYLTHYDPELEDSAISDFPDMLDLIYKLRTIIEVCFLSELNISNERIANVIQPRIKERKQLVEINRK